ncbi:MAG: pyridoxal phosphate-dependent aminotransferase [Pseudomonadota bacterium]
MNAAAPTIESKLPEVKTTIFTVMSQLAAKHGAINLSQGFPDFSPPEALIERVQHHLNAGANQYAPMTGVPLLRERIAEKMTRCYGAAVDVDAEITVTSGATEALFVAVQAVISTGDEVILLDPAYDSYAPAVHLAGGRAVHVALAQPDYGIDWQRLGDAITPRTRLIVVNSPHNPSGAVLATDDLDRLAALVRDTDILLLSDEVYEHMVFDGQPHPSFLTHPELRARSFVVSSFGKTYHNTGWKVGYAIAPPALSAEFRKVHQYVTFSTSTPFQCAIADFMADPTHDRELPDFYEAKRDRFRAGVEDSRFELRPCAGTYFQLLGYQQISDRPDTEMAEWLTREVGVAAIPISVFYRDRTDAKVLRFCFAKDGETLDRATALLRQL